VVRRGWVCLSDPFRDILEDQIIAIELREAEFPTEATSQRAVVDIGSLETERGERSRHRDTVRDRDSERGSREIDQERMNQIMLHLHL
jgi:hypothetical protein